MRWLKITGILIVGLAVFIIWAGNAGLERQQQAAKAEQDRRAALTPAERAAEDKAAADRAARKKLDEAAFARVGGLLLTIKQAANDPGSIKVSAASYTDAGAVALEFRGKNAFGALIKQVAVMAPDGKVAVGPPGGDKIAPLWNRHIAGKTLHPLATP